MKNWFFFWVRVRPIQRWRATSRQFQINTPSCWCHEPLLTQDFFDSKAGLPWQEREGAFAVLVFRPQNKTADFIKRCVTCFWVSLARQTCWFAPWKQLSLVRWFGGSRYEAVWNRWRMACKFWSNLYPKVWIQGAGNTKILYLPIQYGMLMFSSCHRWIKARHSLSSQVCWIRSEPRVACLFFWEGHQQNIPFKKWVNYRTAWWFYLIFFCIFILSLW